MMLDFFQTPFGNYISLSMLQIHIIFLKKNHLTGQFRPLL